MQWSEAVDEYIRALKPIEINPVVKQRVLSVMDLTSLNKSDTNDSIASLCMKAQTTYGHVAAVCVLPQFVSMVSNQFSGTPIKTATVANFPEGTDDLDSTIIQINDALEQGAQEIDVVFPYHRYLASERQYAQTFVAMCRAACGEDALLKVILETGALNEAALIADACYDVLTAGADFVKTSTGKSVEGATLETAATLLLVVRHVAPQLKRPLGVKVAGGIKSLEQATQYLALADQIMGRAWVKPENFRIGASQLVDEIIEERA